MLPDLREYHFTERSYGPHDGKHILYCIIYDYVVRCGFNSWGDWWGENGTFRVLRGVNECDVESSVVGVWAKLSGREMARQRDRKSKPMTAAGVAKAADFVERCCDGSRRKPDVPCRSCTNSEFIAMNRILS